MKNKTNTPKKEKFIIPLELTDSFVRVDERKTTDAEFQKWYAEIVFQYHPINNQIFNK